MIENENEEWKAIDGFPDYEISNLGRVKSVKYGREKILKTEVNGLGYLRVSLCLEGRMNKRRVHRLVASAFLPNPDNKPDIDHIDTDKTNNCVSNLRWATRSENINNPLTIERKRGTSCCKSVLCVETGEIFRSISEASRQTGVNLGSICSCCNGDRQIAGNYHWQYLD